MKIPIPYLKERLASPDRLSLLTAYLGYATRKFFRAHFIDASSLSPEKIDVVIPTISKDSALLEHLIASLRKYLLHPINKIYVVAPKNEVMTSFCRQHDCVFIDELSVLGYGKDSITYRVNERDRSGWIFQQLLKLAGDKFVEMENYLVIDSDTILINPHVFMEKGQWILFQSEEWHEPYFRAFKNLFGYPVKSRLSYTAHMMILNTKILAILKQELETRNQVSWDQAFLSTIDEKINSCVSEYELYANWLLWNFPRQVQCRPFFNISLSRRQLDTVENLHLQYGSRLKSLSFHSYLSD